MKASDRTLATGDRIVFRAGLGPLLEGRFQVMDLEPLRRLALEVQFPFGIVNREVFVITPVSDEACRVAYN